MKYVRNTSRDPKAKGPKAQLGDTPFTFMTRRIGHAYEVYPLIFLAGFWFVIFCATAYYSFTKIEIWLDRSEQALLQRCSCFDLNPSHHGIGSDLGIPTTSKELLHPEPASFRFDRKGVTRQRCELMEILQDEMLEAAKKRGTR
ncbi:unnamed protein product [Cylicostephanus goldi]|uniref:Uncharacterized protein n=1 Tax=Cylicostephanus goldi TaxID=71465 RepID=A0A3P7NQ85_CYLGO|nr:unnamed protein product [Cylicostephanus goldi]